MGLPAAPSLPGGSRDRPAHTHCCSSRGLAAWGGRRRPAQAAEAVGESRGASAAAATANRAPPGHEKASARGPGGRQLTLACAADAQRLPALGAFVSAACELPQVPSVSGLSPLWAALPAHPPARGLPRMSCAKMAQRATGHSPQAARLHGPFVRMGPGDPQGAPLLPGLPLGLVLRPRYPAHRRKEATVAMEAGPQSLLAPPPAFLGPLPPSAGTRTAARGLPPPRANRLLQCLLT